MNTLEATTAYIGGTEIKEIRQGSQIVLQPKGDMVWYKAGKPSLDFNFAKNKSLVDTISNNSYLTYSRASEGTFIDANGLLAYSTFNMHPYAISTSWSTLSNTTRSDNVGTAPDGTFTAGALRETATTGIHYLRQSSIITSSGQPYTFSIYAKQAVGTRNICVDASRVGCGKAVFDLINGTIVSVIAGTANIVNVGDGWYRCSVSMIPTSGASGQIDIIIYDGTTESYTGVAGQGFNIWGAQFERSLTATPLVITTGTTNSSPRFTHNGVTGQSLGLLVEEGRTNLAIQSESFVTPWTKNNSTVTLNSIIGPLGTTTGAIYTENATTTPGLYQTISSLSTTATYTFSIFAKRADTDWIRLAVGSTNGFRVWANLATGTLGSTSSVGTGVVSTASIIALANGWYRISVTGIHASTSALIQINSATGDLSDTRVANSSIYIWGAQFEVGLNPSSYIMTIGTSASRSADIVSFSGANFGRYNSNLVTHNTVLNASYWAKNSFPSLTVYPNRGLAPDGTYTADLVRASSSGNNIRTGSVSVSTSTQSTRSIWLRKLTGTSTVSLRDGTSLQGTTSCTVTTTWQRFTLSETKSAGSASLYLSSLSEDGILVWGAQVENYPTVSDYVPSIETFTSRASTATYYNSQGIIQTAGIDVARNNAYIPDPSGTIYPLGALLLENASTNLLLQSEDFSSTSWGKSGLSAFGSGSISDAILAPDNTLTGDLLIEDASTGVHSISQNVTITAGASITVSAYIKPAVNTRHLRIQALSSGNHYFHAFFDLTTLTVSAQTASYQFGSRILNSAEIIPVGNGWYRVSCSGGVQSTATTATISFIMQNSSASTANSSYAGNGTGGFYIWGAQVETSGYPSSYIKTVDTQVTREADVFTSTASSTYLSTWHSQGQGTWYGESYTDVPVPSTRTPIVMDSRVSTTDIIQIAYANEDQTGGYIRAGSVDQFSSYTSGLTGVRKRRTAMAYTTDNIAATTNGVTITADSLGTIPTNPVSMTIGSASSANYLNGAVSRITFWPQRLSDTTVQSITQ